jgi:hypothetical protein
MLVSLVGSPCSGKTTAAARAFVSLKEQGIVAEFISEQARWYIAKKRFDLKMLPHESLALCGFDQIEIMQQQLAVEQTLKHASGPSVIVVSDSSALNALLYMDEDTRARPEVKEMTLRALSIYDAVFYLKPLDFFPTNDPNRLHDKNFALEFDNRIPALAEELQLKFAGVIETPFDRENLAMRILQQRCAT